MNMQYKQEFSPFTQKEVHFTAREFLTGVIVQVLSGVESCSNENYQIRRSLVNSLDGIININKSTNIVALLEECVDFCESIAGKGLLSELSIDQVVDISDTEITDFIKQALIRSLFDCRMTVIEEEVNNLFDPRAKPEHLDQVLESLNQFVDQYKFVDIDRSTVSIENFKENGIPHKCDVVIGSGCSSATWRINKMLSSIYEARNRIALNDLKGIVDWGKIESDKGTYGAKGAMLIALRRVQVALEKIGYQFNLPHFELIPADVYTMYTQGNDIEPLLKQFWEAFKGKNIVVRSSGVYAEDGENLGAGIYETFGVSETAKFENFRDAVLSVYESVDSDLAVKYRKFHKIDRESMGIIVQEYVGYDETGSWESQFHGYANSQRANVPSVMDVVFEKKHPYFYEQPEGRFSIEGSRTNPFVLIKDALYRSGDWHNAGKYLYFESDYSQELGYSHDAFEISKMIMALEVCFDKPIQVEFIRSKYQDNIVQVRPLPSKWLESKVVTLPKDESYLWWSCSLGVIDEELEVLTDNDNSNKKGIVIIDSSYFANDYSSWIESVLPKEGAVFLMRPTSHDRGHIESRALERGLSIISADYVEPSSDFEAREDYFKRIWSQYGSDESYYLFASRTSKPRVLEPNSHFRSLRVVSDGTQARIYPVQPAASQS